VGYLSKTGKKLNIRTKPVLVHNNTTKLSVLLGLVGAIMILLVPMLIEQVYAKTTGVVRTLIGGIRFLDVEWHLEFGKWVQFPTISSDGRTIEWKTRGTGITGNEKGSVTTRVGSSDVTFSWNNPVVGKNTCKIVVTGLPVPFLPCRITSGQNVVVEYILDSAPCPACNRLDQ
jgi:hypothetical protein